MKSRSRAKRPSVIVALWFALSWGGSYVLSRSGLPEPALERALWILLFPLLLISRAVTAFLDAIGPWGMEPFSATLTESAGFAVVAGCVMIYVGFWYVLVAVILRSTDRDRSG